nr:MAG TPA: hypothetical protein [Caudoviricetes sp.]
MRAGRQPAETPPHGARVVESHKKAPKRGRRRKPRCIRFSSTPARRERSVFC